MEESQKVQSCAADSKTIFIHMILVIPDCSLTEVQ